LGYDGYSNDYHQPYYPPPAPPQPSKPPPTHGGYGNDPYGYAPPPPPGPAGPDYYEQQRQAAQAAARQSREQVEVQKERLKQRMFEATRSGDFLGLEAAFKAGVPANLMEPGTADTPLLIACRQGHADMVRLCLNFGAKNDPHPDFGQTAMHAAVSEGQMAAAAVLLKAAAASQADAVICNLTDPKVTKHPPYTCPTSIFLTIDCILFCAVAHVCGVVWYHRARRRCTWRRRSATRGSSTCCSPTGQTSSVSTTCTRYVHTPSPTQ